MIKGKFIDENNMQYDVMIQKQESKDFDCFNFFNKYVFSYEIKRAVGTGYFVIYRYVLNRYKEILNKNKYFEPYNDAALSDAAIFFGIKEARAYLDSKIANHQYDLDENTTPEIIKY